ncbi:hypothetical protein OnM2_071044 [Erysiphe neolycopersici]|uniref:Uncharacterized protein n=1 Tax=Erysiphe neolycopersici TaxID=212602 RepID=A0A420HK97_9PEZI|nr:hypothetical protein OnM2_071044 [Erysiphe neolycopersici]
MCIGLFIIRRVPKIKQFCRILLPNSPLNLHCLVLKK